jgi:calcium-dependent protein kinase
MGLQGSKSTELDDVTGAVEEELGRPAVEGRYHRLPKRFDNDYTLEKKALGTGYNGVVLQARRKTINGSNDGEKVAIKAFKLHGVGKDKKMELANEAQIFLSMDHPHVARLLDVYESEDQLYLVMECLEGGELFDRVSQLKVFSERDAAKTAKQMLLAVNYLHQKGIVHRDLKLENFLYEKPKSEFLKLIDFGFSKIWEKNTKMEVSCGTLSYVAPEVLAKNYTSQCDMWSFGVVVFILLVGYMPFSGATEGDQIRHIKAGKYTMKKAKWDKVSKLGLQFVEGLIVVNPDKRLTPQAALEHEWIKTATEGGSHLDQSIADSLSDYAKMSKFRKSCMQLMAWSLTREERGMVRDAFLELDTSKTGKINLSQLRNVLESRFHLPKDEAVQVFQALDQNDDEEIQYSEFLAAMMASRIKFHDELLKDTFRRFDTSGSGQVSAENLKEVLGDDIDVDNVMRQVDSNHDGRISYDEFLRFIKTSEEDGTHMDVIHDVIDRETTRREELAPSNPNEDGSPVRLRKRDQFLGLFGVGPSS